MERPPIYGLDIETDTTIDGLDPAVAAVVTAAVSADEGDEVFVGSERDIFLALDRRFATLAPGVIATWNGARFDMPFLAERAARSGLVGGLRLRVDRSVAPRRPVAPHGPAPRPSARRPPSYWSSYRSVSPDRGGGFGFRATWHHHGHLDAYRMYRADVGPILGVSCSLKSIARLVGLTPVEVDRERIHDLPGEALAAYVASDARLARILAERRWPGAARFVDRPAPSRPPRT